MRVKRTLVVIAVFMTALLLHCRVDVMAAAETIQADISLTGKVTNPSDLCIKAGESIYDQSGETILLTDDDTAVSFEKRAGGYAARATLYKGAKYYVTDGEGKVSFSADTDTIVLSFDGSVSQQSSKRQADENDIQIPETESKSTVLNLKTKTPSKSAQGKAVKFVIDSLSGSKDKVSDAFLLQVSLPDGMRLDSIYSGTYNQDVKMQLVCQTEKDGKWHSWYEDISSLKGQMCDTNEFSLSQDDRISAFALSCDNAPEGFEMNKEDPLYYTMTVTGDADTTAAGGTRLTAYVDGKKESSDSASVIEIATQEIIQTGDENFLFIGSMILMIISLVTMFTYITIRILFYRRQEKVESGALPDVVFRGPAGIEHSEKMAALIRDKSG